MINVNELKKVAELVQEKLGKDYKVQQVVVEESNGSTKQGIQIIQGNNNYITYLSQAYFMDKEEGAAQIVRNYYRHRNDDFSRDLFDFDKIKNKIFIRLMNKSMNEHYLSDLVFKEVFDDLVAVPYICIHEDSDGQCTANIKKFLLSLWKTIDEEELIQLAIANTSKQYPFTFQPIESMLGIDNLSTSTTDLWVLTTSNNTYGAATVLYPGIFEMISDELGDDFILLPTSVNEWIVTKTYMSSSFMADMIREINDNSDVISREEILSYYPYKYSKERKTIIKCNTRI